MHRTFFTAVGIAVVIILAGSASADPLKKSTKFKWTVDVTFPDKTTSSIRGVSPNAKIAMQSRSWECEYNLSQRFVDGKSTELGTVLCTFNRAAGVGISTLCKEGDLTKTNYVHVAEDGLSKSHTIRITCASAEASGVAPTAPTIAPVAAYDEGAAWAALNDVDVQSCKKADGPTGSGHITVEFAPSGSVSAALFDSGPFRGTTVGECITGKFRGLHIPAFGGGPVRAGKNFLIE
jgi:hypothetical protein